MMNRPSLCSLTVWTLLSALPLACSATGSTLDKTGGLGDSGGDNGDTTGGDFVTEPGSFGGESCGASTFANQVPGTLLVVLDKSGSMNDAVNGATKWSSTKTGLQAMMQSTSGEVQMGLLPYPAGNFNETGFAFCLLSPGGAGCPELLADGGCTDVATSAAVPVAPLTVSKPGIDAWLGGNGPGGGTPTRYALKNGYQIVRDTPTEGQRYVLLITDGEPSLHVQQPLLPATGQLCGSLADIEAEVAAAANTAPAVNTFVIGSPGSEGASTFLSQLALNGNTAKDAACSPAAGNCHYQIGAANFQAELQQVLQAIAGVISDCVFDVPAGEENVDPNLVNVVVETAEGPVDVYKDPDHQDGWDYVDYTQSKIRLYGAACEAYKAAKGNKLNIVLGCETVLK